MYLPNDLPRDEFLDQLAIWADLHRSSDTPLALVVIRYPATGDPGATLAGAAALRRGLARDFGARAVSCRLTGRALALLVSDATAREVVLATRTIITEAPELSEQPAGLGVVELGPGAPGAALLRALRLARLRPPRVARPPALGARATTWSLAGAERPVPEASPEAMEAVPDATGDPRASVQMPRHAQLPTMLRPPVRIR